MCCCLRSIVRRVDSVGCPVNTGSMLMEPINASDLLQRQSVALQPRDAIRNAAGLRCARVAEVLPAPAHPVHLLRRVHRLKPDGERTGQVRRRGRRAVHRARLQFCRTRGVAFAPANGRKPIAFHQGEEFLASLVAQRLADQGAQGMHVIAQAGVFGGKLNALAIHNARLSGTSRRNIMSLLAQIAIFLAAAVIAVPIFRYFKLGSVLGYLAAGIIIGPAGLGLISKIDATQQIAEFGIVLLMFVIGLELQPSRLWVMRKTIFGLGSAQVLAHHPRNRLGRVLRLRAIHGVRSRHRLRPFDVLHGAGPATLGGTRTAQFSIRPLRVQYPTIPGHRRVAGARLIAPVGGCRSQNHRARGLAGAQVRRRARGRGDRRPLCAAPDAADRGRDACRRGLHGGRLVGGHRHRAAGESGGPVLVVGRFSGRCAARGQRIPPRARG